MPKYPKARPDFQAPGPRVLVEKSINFAEADESEFPPGEDEFEEVAGYGPRQLYYYRSEKILGKLYREIDEHQFLEQLQGQSLPTTLTNQSLTETVWKYVSRKTVLIQWNHLLEFARDIKEK